ncbi:MAG: cytochrome c [Gemmatimonadota bacterium]|nr:cytochrome c [Gemmatimonadota bacterium]
MRRSSESSRCVGLFFSILLFAACAAPSSSSFTSNMQSGQFRQDQILHGRALVVSHACGDCHGGGSNPAALGWLDGVRSPVLDQQFFQIGPFTTRAKNLTPDNATGTGRFTERQIFNALRYGLRPEETADVEITSTVPGQGNFPLHPHYLAIPMPWPSWRHMPDQDLWAIAAYLKSLKPSNHKVQDSDGPPDFWASEYTVEKIGPYPAVPYPTANEKGQH